MTPHSMPTCMQGIIAIEGLNLTAVTPGWHYQACLPAKYGGSDGAPVRCVLAPMDAECVAQ